MSNRKLQYSLPDLMEKMIIDIIKEFHLKINIDDFESEISDLMDDINVILNECKIKVSSALVRKIIALTIINLSIWREKDLMWGENGDEHLKLSHQLNGIRNQIKNIIILNNQSIDVRTNTNIDNLSGWKISL
jgi:hypothetical protein